MIRRAAQFLSLLSLAGLAAATLGPIRWRPRLLYDTTLERMLALAVVGAVASFAFPRRPVLAASAGVGLVIALEAFQNVSPFRVGHGRLQDAAPKIIGVLTGVSCGWMARRLLAAGWLAR